MTLTLEEIKERLKRWDEITLVEELALRSEDIVEDMGDDWLEVKSPSDLRTIHIDNFDNE